LVALLFLGKIHEIIIAFYWKLFISPFSLMNTRTQIANRGDNNLVWNSFPNRANEVKMYRQN
jgi:hypothetical protein